MVLMQCGDFKDHNNTTVKSVVIYSSHFIVLMVFEQLIFIGMALDDLYFSVFSLVYASIEKIYQTLMTVFYYTSKHLKTQNFFKPSVRTNYGISTFI